MNITTAPKLLRALAKMLPETLFAIDELIVSHAFANRQYNFDHEESDKRTDEAKKRLKEAILAAAEKFII